MNRLKERKANTFAIIRFVIIILLFVAFFLTSRSFAYWANGVEGTNTATPTTTFNVSFPSFTNHEFVLNDNTDTYSYFIPINELLLDPQNNIDDVIFGIVWDDASLMSEYLNLDVTADVDVTYELLITKNGRNVNSLVYMRYGSLINIQEDIDNPSTINFNDSAETFGFNVSLNDPGSFNDYSNLSRYEFYVVVTYTINESSIIINN